MKTYVVKDTIKHLERDETLVYFLGADGFVRVDLYFSKGYKRRGDAQRRINKQFEYFNNVKINDYQSIESDKWMHTYEIIEKEEK